MKKRVRLNKVDEKMILRKMTKLIMFALSPSDVSLKMKKRMGESVLSTSREKENDLEIDKIYFREAPTCLVL